MTRAWLALVLVAACGRGATAPPASGPPMADEARAGIEDAALAALLEDHWAATLRAAPTWATALGEEAWDDRLPDRSPEATTAAVERRASFLERARGIDTAGLAPRDALFLRLFVEQLEREQALEVCQTDTWLLSPRINVLVELFDVLDVQPLQDATDAAALLARLRAFPTMVEGRLASLGEGVRAGRAANATSVRLVVEQVRRQLAEPTASWPVMERDAPRGVDPDTWRADVLAALDGSVRPALEAWADFLESRILPVAPGDEAPGLVSLPDGESCYAARIHAYTTLPLEAQALHATGLAELERIHDEFREIGARVFDTRDLATIFDRLRTDPALRFSDREEILATAEDALRRAEAAVPRAFGVLPDTPCVVSEIPVHEAPYTTIAYYRQPAPDGSKPGEYFVNTFEPTTRPRHEAEVLAFHESVPGHHLQIALAYELPATPAFHRFDGSTAFVEGWALYSERLADELGLYSGDVDRLGMLSFDAWRASRLVVDTGVHAMGWTRQEAVGFLLANTPLAENNVRNEVDRYISWPGQALAYKTGQLEILALRHEAEAALGERFDRSAFHDTLLGAGAVSLPVLRERVAAWIAEQVTHEP